MKDVTIASSVATGGKKCLSPTHLWDLATRLFMFKAERWKRRAMFYERHRDYFPRLASGQFITRCRQLEARYRELVGIMFRLALREQLVPVRALTLKKKSGQRVMLPQRLATLGGR